MSISTLLFKGRPGLLTLFSWCLFSVMAYAQNSKISGKILDAKTKETIVGATIKIKGTSAGTVSDVNGHFEINASSGSILQISYIGYLQKRYRQMPARRW